MKVKFYVQMQRRKPPCLGLRMYMKEGFVIGKIIVIDSPCGAGKTSFAIQRMTEDRENSYIFCTPFLGEIARIRRECGKDRFVEPHNFDSSKLDDFNRLLSEGADIAVTHSTFINATLETLSLIEQGEYTIFLDEAMDVIVDFNKVTSVERSPEQTANSKDIEILTEKGFIEIGDHGLVRWVGGDCQGSKFSEVERLARLNRLYCVNGSMLVCVFPPEIFRAFKQVYVMTYLTDGNLIKYYFDIFGLEYTVVNVTHDGIRYQIAEYNTEVEHAFRAKCRELIEVCDLPRLNAGYKKTAFSKNWYGSAMGKGDVVRRLRTDLTYYFTRVAKAKAGNYDILWTCPNEYRTKVQGKGYTCVRQMTSDEQKLKGKELKNVEKKLTCFAPLNTRATNDYKERWALAYCYDMHMHPMIKGFIYSFGLEVNEELFALSCLVQWIFRSRIRDGKKIMLYLPSPRMRKIFLRWLDGQL